MTYTVVEMFEENAVCAVAQHWRQEEGEEKGMARHDAGEIEVNEGYPPLESIDEGRLSFLYIRPVLHRVGIFEDPVPPYITPDAPNSSILRKQFWQ